MMEAAFDIVRSSAHALSTLLLERRTVGQPAAGGRYFELFHATGSPCSQKVLAVLAALDLPFEAVSMQLSKGDTYLPPYVQLRLAACEALGLLLQASHDGSASVERCGADAAVVPTLIDWSAGRVLVDSRRICVYLDELCGSLLRPAPLQAAIDEHLLWVDELPNYQIFVTWGLRKAGTASPFRSGADVAMAKVSRCDRYMAECAADDPVMRAYTAKRQKETSAALHLFAPAAIAQAQGRLDMTLDLLESTLCKRSTAWLLADQPTLADLVWGVELVRLHGLDPVLLGAEGQRPGIAAYCQQLEQLPAIRQAVSGGFT